MRAREISITVDFNARATIMDLFLFSILKHLFDQRKDLKNQQNSLIRLWFLAVLYCRCSTCDSFVETMHADDDDDDVNERKHFSFVAAASS
jgi:hypothetical protein